MKFQLKNVEKELKLLKQKIFDNVNLVNVKTVETLVENLKLETPIDTGNARNSWSFVKINQDNDLNKFRIINSTEYIEYLNKGSSKQAPSHFIEATAIQYGKPSGEIVDVVQGKIL